MSDQDWVQTRWHEDESAGQVTVERVQDVEPILDNNKRLLNDGSNGYSKSKDLKRVASIPLVVLEQWMKEDGVNFLAMPHGPDREKYLRKKLNDPNNKWLRTSGGRM